MGSLNSGKAIGKIVSPKINGLHNYNINSGDESNLGVLYFKDGDVVVVVALSCVILVASGATNMSDGSSFVGKVAAGSYF